MGYIVMSAPTAHTYIVLSYVAWRSTLSAHLTSEFIRIQNHNDPSLMKCISTAFSILVSHISIFARSISATSCLRRSRARSRIACLSSVPLAVETVLGINRLDADGAGEATPASARPFPFCVAVMRGGSEGSVGEEDNPRT